VLLADTSAWIWSRRRAYPELRRWFDERLAGGEIATCDQVRLELLYGTTSVEEHALRRSQLDALHDCPIQPVDWKRAIEVQGRLAGFGPDHQKAVRAPDLLIAAAAERSAVTLLHYDADFDWIRRVTRQPMRWLAPKGTLR
jgi:predicted nucleic acid-binding protein